MDNMKLAEKLALEYPKTCGLDKPKCESCQTEFCEYRAIRDGALMMAEQKDKDLKQFLVEHIDVPYKGVITDEGPIAIEYIEWMEERHKQATEIFEKFKRREG